MSAGGFEAVLVAGPTASGKSALALALAERFGGTIVNTDSMQVYADLHVLSARPEASETARVPHRLYGHVDGAVNYSVGRWCEDARQVIAGLLQERRLPIFVGGTGLYFKALERGLAQMPQVPEKIREETRRAAETLPTAALHEQLARQDPRTAAGLRPTDRQRLLRALEIFAATGRPLSAWQDEPHTPPLLQAGRCLRLFLAPDRDWLYRRIDARFETMIAAGALEEVRALAARGLDPALPVMRAHGVPWLLRHIAGDIPLAEAMTAGKADTRHYAKRQFTWFRHQMPGWSFVPPHSAFETVLAAWQRGAAAQSRLDIAANSSLSD